MWLKSLDELPQEYFQHKFTLDSPVRRPFVVWIWFWISLFFTLLVVSNGTTDAFPHYVHIASYIIAALNGIYILPCFAYCSRKQINRSNRSYRGFIAVSDLGSWLLVIEIWMILTILAMALTCMDRYGIVDPHKGAVAFSFALLVLFAGFATHMYMRYRMVRRIHEGHFRKNGRGFWGEWKNTMLVKIVIWIVAPIVIFLGSASVIIGRFWSITWNDAFNPIAITVAPLLAYGIFFIFAYANTYSYIRKYYVKRFGLQENDVSDGRKSK